MKRNHKDIENLLDRATEAMRTEEVDQLLVDAAASRIQAALSADSGEVVERTVEHIEGCADYQALIPAYLVGNLSDARRLLVEDHTRECLPCRKALKSARTGERPAARPRVSKAAPRPRRTAPVRWAIAAALVAAFGVLPFARYFTPFGSFEAVVEAADGSVYQIERGATRQLAVGDALESGERVRTARDGGAVIKLDDGTRIELRERSELAVTRNGAGTTVRLDRGNVIVVPAKGEKVYVTTPACLVDTTGATVAVTSGTKGSRVSTVEGTAHVESAGVDRELRAGAQFASSTSIEPVPVEREIAWSRNANKYAKTLADLAALRKEIDATALHSESRTSTQLLELAPAGTVLYAAIPNLSASLAEANRLMQQRIAENPTLAEWWKKEQASGHRQGMDRAIETMREFGAYLGPEIAVAVQLDADGGPGAPVVLSTVTDESGFRAMLDRQVAALPKLGSNSPVRIVDDPSQAIDDGAGVSVWIHNGVLVVSPSGQALGKAAAAVNGTEANAFRSTEFFSRIVTEYQQGVSFLVAADLKPMLAQSSKQASLDKLGISGLRYFIVRQSMDGEKSQARAVVTFDGQPQHGIASWLAAPGPMGALEYISPDANFVSAFAVKEPAALVDDLFSFVESTDPNALASLHEFENENGVSLRDDLAAPLGGEFAFAVDGPILPTPSWKMVLEVNDPARLQSAYERMVDAINRQLAAEGKPGLTLSREDANGHTYYAVTSPNAPGEVHYTFVDGYMIVGPSRAILDLAIRYRESGYTILHSQRFLGTLPEDGQANFSALVYHDLAPLASAVAGKLPASKASGDAKAALGELANSGPTLAYAYAHNDRIEFAASGEGMPFGLSPSSLLGLPGSPGLQGLLEKALHAN